MNKEILKYQSVAEQTQPRKAKSNSGTAAKLVDGLTKEEIVVKYASLVKYLAQKLALRLPANIELDDLISAGVMGLMDAVDKYDETRENKFKTYAEFRIRGAMLDELRAQDWVPRSVREKAKQLERVFSRLEQKLGRQATEEEVREDMRLTHEEFQDLLYEVRSISLLNFDDLSSLTKADKKSMVGLVENGKIPNPFAEISKSNVKGLVEKAIKDLPEKQRLVLALYYYEDLNLKEIGDILEVTESRVSQLHTQAILRLRSRLKNKFDEFIQIFM